MDTNISSVPSWLHCDNHLRASTILGSSQGYILFLTITATYKTWLDVSDKEVLLSEHPDINVRGKVKSVLSCVIARSLYIIYVHTILYLQFQQQRMDTFCGQLSVAREKKYPEGRNLDDFHRHLIFNDGHSVIYCFIPKVC